MINPYLNDLHMKQKYYLVFGTYTCTAYFLNLGTYCIQARIQEFSSGGGGGGPTFQKMFDKQKKKKKKKKKGGGGFSIYLSILL